MEDRRPGHYIAGAMSLVRAFMAVVVVSLAVLGLAASAGANNLQTLDADAVSPGHVVVDAAGNAYVSWTSRAIGTGPERVRFCKIPPGGTCTPTSLPIPGATSLSDSASAAIPILGPGDTVYVVGPRYALNDLAFWTSTNGGASFDSGTLRSFYSSKTRPTDAFLSGSTFLIGAYNPGIGFSTAEIAGVGGGSFSFADPGPSVASSSMGLADGNPVIAYWNLDGPQYPLRFYRYDGSGSLTAESNWTGPSTITNGYEPGLAGGPAGLFLVSQDYTGGQYPDAINVRRFEGTSFGPPRTLAVDPSPSLFIGGAIAQSAGGSRVAVAWPGNRAGDNAYVMRLFTSADGGATYSETNIARIGATYAINDNADLAVGDNGAGWIVFTDNNGLQLADLNPIAGLPSGPEKLPGPYKGKTKTISKQVGAFLITLRLPKSCVQSRQRFFAGVGKRKRRALSKKLGGKLKLKKVTFFFDGRKLRIKKRKPFRYLIDPGVMAPGSTHVVKVRVTAILIKGEKKKKVKRTLEGTVRAC
jgi:hypothetical protein